MPSMVVLPYEPDQIKSSTASINLNLASLTRPIILFLLSLLFSLLPNNNVNLANWTKWSTIILKYFCSLICHFDCYTQISPKFWDYAQSISERLQLIDCNGLRD